MKKTGNIVMGILFIAAGLILETACSNHYRGNRNQNDFW